MLYSNVDVTAVEVMFGFDTIYQIQLGERGRGRRLMAILSEKDVVIKEGDNDLHVGITRSGRPKIVTNKGTDKNPGVYLLVSTNYGYTRRGDGTVWSLKYAPSQPKVLAYGWGADGIAGRIGKWNVRFLKMNEGSMIRVRYSGDIHGSKSPDIFTLYNNQLIHIPQENFFDLYDTMDIDIVPFESDGRSIDLSEWIKI